MIKDKDLHIRITSELKKELELAKEEFCYAYMSDLINEAIEQYLHKLRKIKRG